MKTDDEMEQKWRRCVYWRILSIMSMRGGDADDHWHFCISYYTWCFRSDPRAVTSINKTLHEMQLAQRCLDGKCWAESFQLLSKQIFLSSSLIHSVSLSLSLSRRLSLSDQHHQTLHEMLLAQSTWMENVDAQMVWVISAVLNIYISLSFSLSLSLSLFDSLSVTRLTKRFMRCFWLRVLGWKVLMLRWCESLQLLSWRRHIPLSLSLSLSLLSLLALPSLFCLSSLSLSVSLSLLPLSLSLDFYLSLLSFPSLFCLSSLSLCFSISALSVSLPLFISLSLSLSACSTLWSKLTRQEQPNNPELHMLHPHAALQMTVFWFSNQVLRLEQNPYAVRTLMPLTSSDWVAKCSGAFLRLRTRNHHLSHCTVCADSENSAVYWIPAALSSHQTSFQKLSLWGCRGRNVKLEENQWQTLKAKGWVLRPQELPKNCQNGANLFSSKCQL